ncbi:MAG: LPS assembly protein LptD [Planctomycetia bacterium]|nr:LPS assembly protein LptD [Planctomycetia bacterium]
MTATRRNKQSTYQANPAFICIFRRAAMAAILATIVLDPCMVRSQILEQPITPTIYPILKPTGSISVPLQVAADHTTTWENNDGTIHILAEGQVRIEVGYRRIAADHAVIWLHPQGQGQSGFYKVQIYLAGQVVIREGAGNAAVSTAEEMLVTTRITARVRLSGPPPLAKNEAHNPIVLRGKKLIEEIATAPQAPEAIPTIEISPTELALSNGWFARGSRLPAPPAPRQPGPPVALHLKPGQPPHRAPPTPIVMATGNIITEEVIGRQRVTVAKGEFFLFRKLPGHNALELRANNAVMFSPIRTRGAAGAPVPTKITNHSITQKVLGVYLDGDVMITYGHQTLYANQVYYDFTTNRAILLHAVLSSEIVQAKSPLYMRAGEIIQEAQGQFEAKSVKLSTDEFYQPHYYIGASAMTVRSIAAPTPPGGKPKTAYYAFTATKTTANFFGVPFFYWPYVSGTTQQSPSPLKAASIGDSNIFGVTATTDWNLLELMGITPPGGVEADVSVNEYSKRGPAVGLNSRYDVGSMRGVVNSSLMYDTGTDQLGANRDNLPVPQHTRGYIFARHLQQLSRQWSVAVEGSYVSDPNYLEQYFPYVYATAPEQQTSVYVEQQHHTEAFTVLGKWNLTGFITNADLENNEYTVQRYPEAHYYREGDKLLGLFTYYSDTSGGMINDQFSDTTSGIRALQLNFPGLNPNETFSQYYLSNGWTDQPVARVDSRQEIDFPMAAGPVQFDPFVSGRLTYWDTTFPAVNNQIGGGTTRVWGTVGFRSSTTFSKLYPDVKSDLLDIDQLRHIIEPQISMFVTGANIQQGYLQPFDRNVEGITDASGAEFALRQMLQTKRGRPGQRQIVNWITFNVAADVFWNNHLSGPFDPNNPQYAGAPFSTSDFGTPVIGYYDWSRPELSQIADSINANFKWRLGANVEFLADESWNINVQQLEELDSGVEVNQTPNLSYFLGNRYIRAVDSDQWTAAISYKLTSKYSIAAAESYDFALGQNVLSEVSLVREIPRFFVGITLAYNADTASSAAMVSIWPAGFPQAGITHQQALEAVEP